MFPVNCYIQSSQSVRTASHSVFSISELLHILSSQYQNCFTFSLYSSVSVRELFHISVFPVSHSVLILSQCENCSTSSLLTLLKLLYILFSHTPSELFHIQSFQSNKVSHWILTSCQKKKNCLASSLLSSLRTVRTQSFHSVRTVSHSVVSVLERF